MSTQLPGPSHGGDFMKDRAHPKKQTCLLWALVNPLEDRKSYFFGTKLSWNSPALTSLLLSILFIFLIFFEASFALFSEYLTQELYFLTEVFFS